MSLALKRACAVVLNGACWKDDEGLIAPGKLAVARFIAGQIPIIAGG